MTKHGAAAITVMAITTFFPPPDGMCNSILPVNGPISSAPGWRIDPITKTGWKWHHGWDFAVPEGTPVKATAGGKVYIARRFKGYGNLVVIDHQNGWFTLYGHNSKLLTKEGDWVRTGQRIALSGNTGRSSGPHVHYEVRYSPGFLQEQKLAGTGDQEETDDLALR